MAKKNRKLGTGMQSLEEKAMMAGDVAVTIANGDLFIDEAADSVGDAQQVQISQLSNGRIRVQGLGDTRIQSSVSFNGQEFTSYRSYYDIYSDIDDINVNLGGGSDSLTMLNYNGGVDADQVDIRMGGGGADRDRVSITGLNATGELKIDTGADVDDVIVSGSTIGDSWWEDLEIDTGAGADSVRVSQTLVADDIDLDLYSSIGEADRDSVSLSYVTADDVFANLGNGDDVLTMTNSNIDDDVRLDMGYDSAANGQDDDYVYLGFNTVDDDIRIDGRDGNDDVRAAFNSADDVDFNGGSGVDNFYAWYASGQNSNDFDDLDLSSANFRTYGYV